MSKEQLRQYYHRFRGWQQAAPHYVNRHEGTTQHCRNCDATFSGNFCPVCGQRAELGRVGWQSIKDNIALLWGMDSRSLGYTLLQLLGRPGYLVRDYISGRRQVSFPPVKMLVIVCLFVVIFETVFHVKKDVVGIKFNVQEIDNIIGWINSQKSWATLFLQSFYILPTWLVFRFAPSYSRHTLPEGFFLQVFLSVLSLLLVFFGYLNKNLELALWIIYMYITYRQLFGYGWWGTLWRLAVMLLLAVMAIVVAVVILGMIYDNEDRNDTLLTILFISAIASELTAVILYIVHRTNKRTYHNNSKEIISNL